ncbi:MAG: alpha-L-fucosidase [Planctomycetota bacterium]
MSADAQNTTPYNETWTSLRRHQTPPWLIDAKFGVYCHWGISTIQYQKENAELSDEAALADWTAERFDAEEWAELFVRAGAKFGGPIAWHGSPLVHWDSALSDHNTMKKGPRRDILGEMEKAVRARGLKFMASFHSIGDDGWLELAEEAVDCYLPDLFWVDASFGGTKQANHLKIVDGSRYLGRGVDPQAHGEPNPGAHPADRLEQLSERFQKRFIAHYYNRAAERGCEVEFVYKSHDIPPGVGMRDLENGLLPHVAYDPWMTDIDMNVTPDWPIHGWFYRDGVPTRSAAKIVHLLMDVVSKNGVLLLNVPPLADGSFPDEVRRTVEAVGEWLKVNGEAVYGASPWGLYGEGPTVPDTGNYAFHHNDHFDRLAFTPEDIRVTVNGQHLYAACLGVPADGRVCVRAFNTRFKLKPGTITGVSLLGCDAPVEWTHDDDGLTIDLPAGFTPSPLASVFKVETL